METISSQPESKPKSNFFTLLAIWKKASVGRILVSVFVLLVTFLVLYEGFFLLRDSTLPQAFLIIIAIIWGVGGAGLLFTVTNFVVEQLSEEWMKRLQPLVFVGPALFLLAWFLAIPTVRTFALSFLDANGSPSSKIIQN